MDIRRRLRSKSSEDPYNSGVLYAVDREADAPAKARLAAFPRYSHGTAHAIQEAAAKVGFPWKSKIVTVHRWRRILRARSQPRRVLGTFSLAEKEEEESPYRFHWQSRLDRNLAGSART